MACVETRVTVCLQSSEPPYVCAIVMPRTRGARIHDIAAAAVRMAMQTDNPFMHRTSACGETLDGGRTLEEYGLDDETPLEVHVWWMLSAGNTVRK